MQLPNGPVPGGPFVTSTGVKNYLEQPLAVGDVVSAWGIYATGSRKFSVNFMMENEQHFMIHVDFRNPPGGNAVWLISYLII